MRLRNKYAKRSLVDTYLSSDVSLEKGSHDVNALVANYSEDDIQTCFAKLFAVASVAIDDFSSGDGNQFYENMRVSLGNLRERFEQLPNTNFQPEMTAPTLTSLDRGSQ